MNSTTVTCGGCGQVLTEDPGLAVKPPCPNCGSSARNVHVQVSDSATATDEVVSLEKVREYVERNPYWTAALGLLTIVGALATWLLSRWIVLVVVAALAFGVLRYFVSTRASVRVREREKIGPFR